MLDLFALALSSTVSYANLSVAYRQQVGLANYARQAYQDCDEERLHLRDERDGLRGIVLAPPQVVEVGVPVWIWVGSVVLVGVGSAWLAVEVTNND